MYGKPLAYVVKIDEVSPIAGADRIELAKVMDYTVVVKKGEFQPGDRAMYVEVDSLLPDGFTPEQKATYDAIVDGSYFKGAQVSVEEADEAMKKLQSESKYPYFEFLRQKKFKIKSMKLGKFGVISQGILFDLKLLGEPTDLKVGTDLTLKYNVTEIVLDEEEAGLNAVVDTSKDGWFTKKLMRYAWFRNWRKKRGTYNKWLAEWPSKSDEENVQKIFTKMKAKYGDKEWVATEKLEGQNITIYSYETRGFFGKKKKIGVCSRTRSLSPADNSGKSFWGTVKRMHLDDKIKAIPGEWFCRGEHVGPGIQKNIYKLARTEVYFFDFYRKVDGKFVKLNFEESVQFAKTYDLPFVPVLDEHYKLPETAQEMLAQSDKNTVFGNDLKHKREGFVLRLKDDYTVSFKVKNPFYTI